MDNENKKNRREFLGDVLKAGSIAAVGGLVCLSRPGKAIGAGSSTIDIISMTKIDPEMILYEEVNKPVSTGFVESRFVTVDKSGALFLAGDQVVKEMDSHGRIKDTVELSVVPFCLVPVDDGFYIGTRDRIVITDKNGGIRDTWKSLGENAWITNIALTDKYIFIADAGQRIVWCYDPDGNFVRRIGDKNTRKEYSRVYSARPIL